MDEAVTIACQITEALMAAHSEGFVHRDIKPSNILLADDRAILADFGLARAVDVISAEQLTESGVVIGTPAYMSPEQSTSGRRIDGRSDIYSLGCVIYEMLAGDPPFTGPTAQAMLARHAVDPVPSLRTVRDTLSPGLESVIVKALAKVPADRYASAAELRDALLSLPPVSSAASWRTVSTRPRLLQRRSTMTVLIGALIGLLATGLWLTRHPATPVHVVRREPLLIADFAGLPKDSALGSVIAEALRIDFSQSHVVRVIPPPQIAEVLSRMHLPPTTRLTAELSREIALREGIKALITGEVAEAGARYIISVSLIAAGTGETVIGRRETVQDSAAIIGAIDRVSKFMRARIGESLALMQTEPALSHAATGSLDALRKFTLAGHAFYLEGNAPKARVLYEEAIGLDSTFGLAYVGLTTLLLHAYEQETDRIAWSLSQAFAQRDRLPLRDRYLVEGSYYNRLLFDFDKAIATYRALLDLYPDDTQTLADLGSVCYSARHFALGDSVLRRFLALDSTSHYEWLTLVDHQLGQGKVEEAKATIQHLARSFPRNEEVDWWLAEFETTFGHYDLAEAALDSMIRRYPRTVYSREWVSWSLAQIAAVQGQLGKAEGYLRQAMAASAEEGSRVRYFEFATTLAAYDLRIGRRPDLAMKELDRALIAYPLDSLPPLERPYLALGELMARAGHPRRAREFLAQYEEHVDPVYRQMAEGDKHTRHSAHGELDLAEGRLGDAIVEFRAWSESGQCLGCGLTALARAYARAGQADSAVAVYQRYLTTLWIERIVVDADQLAASYRELGRLYAVQGDTTQAVQAYERLLELWKHADQELRPQVAEIRQQLADLRPRAEADRRDGPRRQSGGQ